MLAHTRCVEEILKLARVARIGVLPAVLEPHRQGVARRVVAHRMNHRALHCFHFRHLRSPLVGWVTSREGYFRSRHPSEHRSMYPTSPLFHRELILRLASSASEG